MVGIKNAWRGALFLVFGWSAQVLWGQSAFLIPKKIKNHFQTQLLLSEYADLVYLERNLSRFDHIEVVKVNGTVDIAKAAFLCSKLSLLQEVQLHQFQGIIENADLQYLEWVPQLSIYIPKNRVDATVLNEAWNLLSKVSLRFEEVPDNFDFLIGWKQLRSLSILGDMGKEEADALLKVVGEHLPRLKHLELSLLGVNELPPRIKKCTQLHALRIIDGSDWAQGKLIEDLGETVIPLRIGSKTVNVGKGKTALKVERNVYMPLKWISSKPSLNTREMAHLKMLFPDVEESEALTWLEDTEEEIDFATAEDLVPFVRAPITDKKQLIPEFTDGSHTFIAHTASDHVLLGDASWAVLIPKESLQDLQGKPYSGNYVVSIQFLSEAEQLIAAGMDMSYDSGRTNFLLHPAFCLNIRVVSEDRKMPLALKLTHRVEVHFTAPLDESDRFYAWNAKTQKWMHYYDYDYQFDEVEKPAKVDFYQFYKGQQTAKLQGNVALWTIDEAFETQGFNYLMPPHLYEMKLGKWQNHYVLHPVGAAKELKRMVRGNTQIGIRLFPRNRKVATGIQELIVFDRTHGFFPEWDAFEGFRMAFKTQHSFEQVSAFFKDRNWVDARMKRKGDYYELELRTHRQIWTIDILRPSHYMNAGTEEEKLKLDQQLERRFQRYWNMREAKKSLWMQWSNSSQVKDLEYQKNHVFGAVQHSRHKKGRMILQSFGEFTMAHPVAQAPERIELILCEMGKIPIDIKRVALAYEESGITTLFPVVPHTKQIGLNKNGLRFLIAENKKGELFYLTGEALRALQLMENTLAYVELKPMKTNPKTSEEWTKEMGIRNAKKRLKK